MSVDWDEYGDRLAAQALAQGDVTGWFDRLYHAGATGEVSMPWNRRAPHWALADWAEARELAGDGRRAIVAGSGLGADAEYLATLGFRTVAFDVAETAVRLARERFPQSTVEYVQADLLDPPAEWTHAFDLVVEVITVQALPESVRPAAIANVSRLVGPNGTLVVVAAAREDHDDPGNKPPWPLSRAEVETFAADGLRVVQIEKVADPAQPAELRWRAEFHRPAQ